MKDASIAEQIFSSPPPKPKEVVTFERNPSETMMKLTTTIMPSLKAALEKLASAQQTSKPSIGDVSTVSDPTQMMQCENFGCSVKISREEMEQKDCSLIEDCLHHPKPPIFHEG